MGAADQALLTKRAYEFAIAIKFQEGGAAATEHHQVAL